MRRFFLRFVIFPGLHICKVFLNVNFCWFLQKNLFFLSAAVLAAALEGTINRTSAKRDTGRRRQRRSCAVNMRRGRHCRSPCKRRPRLPSRHRRFPPATRGPEREGEPALRQAPSGKPKRAALKRTARRMLSLFYRWRKRARNSCVRGFWGCSKISSGVPSSAITPSAI